MEQDSVKKYLALMSEVKRRISVIDAAAILHLSGKAELLVYRATTLEAIYLQFRKILELIAMGSLVANRQEFSQAYEKFAQYRNAKVLIQDMQRVNPGFWPKSIIQEKSEQQGGITKWIDREDCLTKGDLIKLYEKCGKILHAENPYGSKIEYGYYDVNIKDWRNKIVNLLNAHTIQLVNNTDIYLIQMGAEGKYPTYHPFSTLSPSDDRYKDYMDSKGTA